MRAKLSEQDIAKELTSLAGWSLANGKLHRELAFENFIHAFGFMTASAIAIEKQNHHPEWSNVYNRVSIDLVTHDSGGVTKSDIELAHTLENLAAKFAGL